MSNEKLYRRYQENDENFQGDWDKLDEILTQASREMGRRAFCRLEADIKALMLRRERKCFLDGAAAGRAAG